MQSMTWRAGASWPLVPRQGLGQIGVGACPTNTESSGELTPLSSPPAALGCHCPAQAPPGCRPQAENGRAAQQSRRGDGCGKASVIKLFIKAKCRFKALSPQESVFMSLCVLEKQAPLGSLAALAQGISPQGHIGCTLVRGSPSELRGDPSRRGATAVLILPGTQESHTLSLHPSCTPTGPAVPVRQPPLSPS